MPPAPRSRLAYLQREFLRQQRGTRWRSVLCHKEGFLVWLHITVAQLADMCHATYAAWAQRERPVRPRTRKAGKG